MRPCEQEAAREERKRKAAAAKQAREVQQAQQQAQQTAQQVLQAMQQAPLIVTSAPGQLTMCEVVRVHESPVCRAFSLRHHAEPSCLLSLISRDCALLRT